jgi:MFS superfamily sulfate permease-like transporter
MPVTAQTVVRDIWAGVLTGAVFYAEYISLGAALGNTLPGPSGAAMGTLMVLGAVIVSCIVALLLPRPLLTGPRAASLAVLIAGMKFASAQALHPEVRLEVALVALTAMLLTAAGVQLLGLLRPVQTWIYHCHVAIRKGFMFASGIGIVAGLGTAQLDGCLRIAPAPVTAIVVASVIAALTWNAWCKYPGNSKSPFAKLGPLAIPVGVAMASAGYYLFIVDQATGGYCGTLGSTGLKIALLGDIVTGPTAIQAAAHNLPLWVWPLLLAIGVMLGGVMLLETLTTLRDSKDHSDRAVWAIHIKGSALVNLLGAPLGLSCASLSTSRTNALIESHAASRLAVLAHGACVLILVLCFSPLIARLPQLAIAVALLLVAIQMIDDETRDAVWRGGFASGARPAQLHTTWAFLCVLAASVIAGVAMHNLGWGFGGGPLVALVLAAVLLNGRLNRGKLA